MREKILSNMDYLGISFDPEVNKNIEHGKAVQISNGKTKVYVIPTNEELVIARETLRLK